MKVTMELIKSKIKSETYLVMPDGRTTMCQLSLENGYSINGLSACVDAAEFNRDIGRRFAFEDALRQIWALEGYLLAEKIYQNSKKSWAATLSENKIIVRQQKKRTTRVRKIMDEAAKIAEAPYGLKKDGTPKKRPGRPAAK